MSHMLRFLIFSLCLLLAPLTAAAERMTMIIERGPETVEVFFGLPADQMLTVFSLPPERLEDETGSVAFEPLRLGTWEIGDELFAPVEARIGGGIANFEAMSLMVHPEDQKLPLYDAFDGLMAIAVCSVEPPENPTLRTLYSYVGFIDYPDDPYQPISFTFPNTGRDMLEVEIRDFRGGTLMSERLITLEDGGAITLEAVRPPMPRWIVIALVAGATLTVTGAGAFFAKRIWDRRNLAPA